jgi:hypothetical protein
MALEISTPTVLPAQGAVGGVDIGWSEKRRSSAAAQLSWDCDKVTWQIERFRATDADRKSTFDSIFSQHLLAAAFDGPLTTGLLPVTRYRFAERMLTAGFQPLIGKPGQANAPNGIRLNDQANKCALALIAMRNLAESQHTHNIHYLAVAEAFPTSFLGVMLQEPFGIRSRRKKHSDNFFEILAEDGTLADLLNRLLPKRSIPEISQIKNHDDRAAFVCAVTALCLAANDYTAVGDHDGWIILPPLSFIQPWALALFDANARNHAAYRISSRVRLGLAQGMYPPMSLEELNSTDQEIAHMFYADSEWEPR